jgi:glycerol-3-phosphate cytidylyltransferase
MAIIYYPGCWDIPHIGHINAIEYVYNYVKERVAQEDYVYKYDLVIGVESDKLCEKFKRKPYFNQDERRKFVSEYSDEIPIIYTNHNYKSHYDYDIFACGPEFGNREEQKEHLDWCSKNNIEILKVPRTEGISTTEIVRRIKNEG